MSYVCVSLFVSLLLGNDRRSHVCHSDTFPKVPPYKTTTPYRSLCASARDRCASTSDLTLFLTDHFLILSLVHTCIQGFHFTLSLVSPFILQSSGSNSFSHCIFTLHSPLLICCFSSCVPAVFMWCRFMCDRTCLSSKAAKIFRLSASVYPLVEKSQNFPAW